MTNADAKPSYDELVLQNGLLMADVAELKSQINLLKFQMLDFQRKLFGSKSERFAPLAMAEQTALNLNVEAIADVEVTTKVVKEHTRTQVELKPKNHKGRNPFGAHLRREVIVLKPEENTEGLKEIGVEVTETIEHTPASFYVKRIERTKYAKPGNGGVLTVPLPERALGKSMFGNSFAAHVLVNKFVDHLPEYRQLQILKRADVHIAYSSFNDISTAVAHCLLMPYDELKKQTLSSSYLQVDETSNRVLTPEKPGTTHQGYYWVYRCPVKNLVLFDYHPSRSREGPREILKNFKGKLQTDGYVAYEEFGDIPDIILFHCWAHARRHFEKALDSDKLRAEIMMKLIQQLYATERKAKEQHLSFDKRKELRQAESIPVLAQIREWLDKNTFSITPESPMGKAIYYTNQRWEGLTHYSTDGMLEIDNNWVENSIRPLTLGRKNYLFAGSHEGAKRAAILYSFFGTCKLRGINPYTWLKDTLDKLPSLKGTDLHTLIP